MKRLITGFVASAVVLGGVSLSQATQVTLVDQGAEWQYQVLSTDLWPNWSTAGYDSFDWDSGTWSTGAAAFGNPYSQQLPHSTYWGANTDLALQTTFWVDGTLSSVTLNVAVDNGFIVFVNGQQVAKANAEGYTSYWEYTFELGSSPFVAGENLIQVLAEDHGVATFFDLKLTGDVTQPVPEPGTLALLGTGVVGLMGYGRRRMKK